MNTEINDHSTEVEFMTRNNKSEVDRRTHDRNGNDSHEREEARIRQYEDKMARLYEDKTND